MYVLAPEALDANRLLLLPAREGIVLVAGREQRGRWSVGSDGRLHADLADGPTVAEAWVAGDQLTIALGGQGMTLRRA